MRKTDATTAAAKSGSSIIKRAARRVYPLAAICVLAASASAVQAKCGSFSASAARQSTAGGQAMSGGGGRQGGEREVARARADISGDGVKGEAEFVEVERGTERFVRVTVRVKGDASKLKAGLHGVHIHEKALCESPFTSAGGHFDPGPASNSDPDVNHPYHMGDLPNINVGADGSGTLEATTTRITLSDGPLSVMDADGSAILIHGNQDQLKSGATKSGVSGGPRVACGLIKRQ